MKWMFLRGNRKSDIPDKIVQDAKVQFELATVKRLRIVTAVISVAYLLFGFASYNFISKFKPDLTLFENVWPRVAFNAFPFILFFFYLTNEKISPVRKINFFI